MAQEAAPKTPERPPQIPNIPDLGLLAQGAADLVRGIPQRISPVTQAFDGTLKTAGQIYDFAQLARTDREKATGDLVEGTLRTLHDNRETFGPYIGAVLKLVLDLAYNPSMDVQSQTNRATAVSLLRSFPSAPLVVAPRHSTHGDHPVVVKQIQDILQEAAFSMRDPKRNVICVVASARVWEKDPKYAQLVDIGKSAFHLELVPVIQDYEVLWPNLPPESPEAAAKRIYTPEYANRTNFITLRRMIELNKKVLAALLVYIEGTRADQDGPMNGAKGHFDKMVAALRNCVILPASAEWKTGQGGYSRDGLNFGKCQAVHYNTPILVTDKQVPPDITDTVMTSIAELVPPHLQGPWREKVLERQGRRQAA